VTAYHEDVVPADYLAQLPKYPPNQQARAAVDALKQELIALYDAHGAIHYQLGRAYPYAPRIDDTARKLIEAIKLALDPNKIVGPGVLGL